MFLARKMPSNVFVCTGNQFHIVFKLKIISTPANKYYLSSFSVTFLYNLKFTSLNNFAKNNGWKISIKATDFI
jgi:hypothetical protein